MKYYIIAGERSGDLHASNLIKSVKQTDSHATVRGIGGDYMASSGVELFMHYSEVAVMGFWEVFKNIRRLKGYMKACEADILRFNPDAIILVDFGGFNLRIAKFCKQRGIKTFYYISPKVWAWNQKRALKIKQHVDHMFVILPFETSFFKKFDYHADYVGNPLFDAIKAHTPANNFLQNYNLGEQPIIAILPGSRKQEVTKILSYMLEIVGDFPDYQFVVAGVRNLPEEVYAEVQKVKGVKVIYESTYDLLSHAKAAIVTSGTATLETALFNVPQVVCYKTSGLTYAIAKNLIAVKYISLVNLIADKPVVKELIQGDLNSANLVDELKKITSDKERRASMLNAYAEIKDILGDTSASDNASQLIEEYLKGN